MSEWANGRMGEWANERMGEWANERMLERSPDCIGMNSNPENSGGEQGELLLYDIPLSTLCEV